MSKLWFVTRFTATTFAFTAIQIALTCGLSRYLHGLTLQTFSKVLPNVGFGTIALGFLFAFNYGTSSSRIGGPDLDSKMAGIKLRNTLFSESDNDFGIQQFGRTLIVSGLIALAIYQFVIPLLSS